jgi:hypothetical protein
MWCHPTGLERRDDNDHFGTADHRRVDTHLDMHVAAALDERGALLGVESFETTPAGYDKLLTWLRAFGTVELLGVEGTGSYGAGLTRHLHGEGVRVVEVDRPNRQRRRRHGKSDPEDATTHCSKDQEDEPDYQHHDSNAPQDRYFGNESNQQKDNAEDNHGGSPLFGVMLKPFLPVDFRDTTEIIDR